MILPNFAKNCVKLRKLWAMGEGGRVPGVPPNPPLVIQMFNKGKIYFYSNDYILILNLFLVRSQTWSF